MIPLDLAYKPDAARAAERLDAWWHGAILDRPTIQITAPNPVRVQVPDKSHATLRERWLDAEYAVERADAWMRNTCWLGEILPTFFPNVGPEVMTASLGAELIFGEETSWSVPILHDWDLVPTLKVSADNPYVAAILRMTELALDMGRGKFLAGITDLHPGGDLAASLRDPQQLCLDIATEPEKVDALMKQIFPCFFDFYELQYQMMKAGGQDVTTSWIPLISPGRYYIPSCDFACLVSPRQFQRFFLPEIAAEVEWLDRSIFHLDGPDAVRHLDALLELEGLGGVQFVCGAGKGPSSRWMPVFQRIQNAGKNIHVSIGPDEIDAFMSGLRPEGVMLSTGARSVEHGEAIIKQISGWTGRQNA